MEIPISDTVSVIILIVGIANILLWFKIWFMTDDVKRMRALLREVLEHIKDKG